MVETLQTVQIADYVAVLVFRASVDGGVASYHGAPSSSVAGAQLLHDYAAFVVDLLRLQTDELRPVVQDQQCGVDRRRVCCGHIVQVVACFIVRGVGIQVRTEFDAVTLQIFYHLFARQVLGAVEGHVFEEVGEALLGIFLLDSSYVVENVEGCLSLGFFVVTDVVRHAVFESSDAHLLIGGNRHVRL